MTIPGLRRKEYAGGAVCRRHRNGYDYTAPPSWPST